MLTRLQIELLYKELNAVFELLHMVFLFFYVHGVELFETQIMSIMYNLNTVDDKCEDT